MKPKFFCTISCSQGEIMMGSKNPITDLRGKVETAKVKVGFNLYKIADYLKQEYGWERIEAPTRYIIKAESNIADTVKDMKVELANRLTQLQETGDINSHASSNLSGMIEWLSSLEEALRQL